MVVKGAVAEDLISVVAEDLHLRGCVAWDRGRGHRICDWGWWLGSSLQGHLSLSTIAVAVPPISTPLHLRLRSWVGRSRLSSHGGSMTIPCFVLLCLVVRGEKEKGWMVCDGGSRGMRSAVVMGWGGMRDIYCETQEIRFIISYWTWAFFIGPPQICISANFFWFVSKYGSWIKVEMSRLYKTWLFFLVKKLYFVKKK